MMESRLSESANMMSAEMDRLDALEANLTADLEEQLADLKVLEEERKKIGNPNTLGETVLTVVWEQVVNQIGTVAGEDFIRENRGLRLDLSKDAHIQTTENFAEGKIATHNTEIDYQERYDGWQANFQRDENGNVVTRKTRSGEEVPTLTKNARDPYDNGRTTGSKERGTDMDHTVPAAEMIRDPAANAHMTEGERVAFANSEKNLNEMPASQNRSKGDNSMSDWLDNPNAKGQKPDEIFDGLDEEAKSKLREKDREAREELEKRKREGEQRSIEAGKKSRKEEAFRIGGKALRTAVMGMLAELIKGVLQKFIAWLGAKERSFATLIERLKAAIKGFFSNLTQALMTAGNAMVTSIATAVFGPIVSTIKKAWIFLKQGAKSLKEAFEYIRNPAHKDKPVSILLLEVGKIVMSGIAAAGAIALGEVLEAALMSIPGFGFEIPFFGSLASILGMFLGALISGLIGALALNLMDRAIANILERENRNKRIDQGNALLASQDALLGVKIQKTGLTQATVAASISERHKKFAEEVSESLQTIYDGSSDLDNGDALDKTDADLDSLLG